MALPTYISVVAAFFAYPVVSKAVVAYLTKKFTFVNELLAVNKPRIGGRKIKGTAVIAGGGGGGLITACILTKHFTRVVIVEPEEWVNTEEGMKYEKPEVRVVNGLRTPYSKRRRVAQFLSLHSKSLVPYICFEILDMTALYALAWPSFVLAFMRQLFPRWDQHITSEGGMSVPVLMSSPKHISNIPC